MTKTQHLLSLKHNSDLRGGGPAGAGVAETGAQEPEGGHLLPLLQLLQGQAARVLEHGSAGCL